MRLSFCSENLKYQGIKAVEFLLVNKQVYDMLSSWVGLRKEARITGKPPLFFPFNVT
mgnify:CR=1 FL=1